MYLRISCYCDACLNSSDLRVGVTTLLNTIQWPKTYLTHDVTHKKPETQNHKMVFSL